MVFSEVWAEVRKQTRDGEAAREPQKGATSSLSLPRKSQGNMLEVSVLSGQKKNKNKETKQNSATPQAYEKHPYHQLTHIHRIKIPTLLTMYPVSMNVILSQGLRL